MKKLFFWLRWAWRDLRTRWTQVAAIAFIIALATGIFAGLGGQETWRIASMDLSYESLALHDLKISLTTGSLLPQSQALAVLEDIEGLAAVEPRLVMDTMVDASQGEQTILVSGRVIGVDFSQGGPQIERIHIDQGRLQHPNEVGVVVLETKFSRHYDLQPGNRVQLMGGEELTAVGFGVTPEYFMVMPPEQTGFDMLGESSMAIVYMALPEAQAIYGYDNQVNEILIQLAEGVDHVQIEEEIFEQMSAAFPQIGIFLTRGEDNPARVMMYEDAVEDQEMLNMIAVFFLIGASLAAYNLAGRLVESQQRQIGIGMALGLPRWKLALRPLLVGLQIAFFGLLLGIPLGYVFTQLFGNLMVEMAPLPFYAGSLLHPPSFLIAAALGILLPLLSTFIPVIQAVRKEPLETLQGHLAAKDSGLNRWLKGARLPGNTFSQLPLKNILRSPKRSLLTIAGIAMAIALLFMFTGFLDSFLGTLDQMRTSMLYRSPERLVIILDFFYPVDHEQVDDLQNLETADGQLMVSTMEPWLRLGGHLRQGEQEIETMLEYFPINSQIWVPNLLRGTLSGSGEFPGIILSNRAARDLGLDVGDVLVLEHPFQEGLFSFRTEETEVQLIGIHDSPIRGLSYLALDDAEFTGLSRTTNMIVVNPAPGVRVDDIRADLFYQPGILTINATSTMLDFMDELLVMFVGVLRVMQIVGLLIAFLIAYNSTSINIDDRKREVATMFAYGVGIRKVVFSEIGENLILGLIGTVTGGFLGWWVLKQMMLTRMETMIEEMELLINISPFSIIAAVVLGVVLVSITPIINARKLKRIDIPSTLRVIE